MSRFDDLEKNAREAFLSGGYTLKEIPNDTPRLAGCMFGKNAHVFSILDHLGKETKWQFLSKPNERILAIKYSDEYSRQFINLLDFEVDWFPTEDDIFAVLDPSENCLLAFRRSE
jgi:hypothetical protein